MLEFLKRHLKNEKGLSLVELLAVIVILGIVAAIAIPSIGNIINNQRDKAILSEISGMISSAKIAVAEGSCGVDNQCVYDSTANSTTNEIEYRGSKVVSGTIDLSDSSNPEYTAVLGTDVSFSANNATAYNALLDSDEETLNEALEGR